MIIIPIVYGSIANPLTNHPSGHSHKWTVYIHSATSKDISWLFEKVQFNLHESFNNPKRVITDGVYEVSETGWGEFEIVIKLFFKENLERTLSLYHQLRLFPPLPPGSDVNNPPPVDQSAYPVISEHYDELVFPEPLPRLLELHEENKAKLVEIVHTHEYTKQYELKELSGILDGLNKIRDEIQVARGRLDELKQQKKAGVVQLAAPPSATITETEEEEVVDSGKRKILTKDVKKKKIKLQ